MSTVTERSTASEKTKPNTGRGANGRFAAGNPGGPGNPYARKVAELRQALVNFVTAEDMKEIALVLKEKAKMGNLAAIKLLYQYALGKPLAPTDPDRLDVDEWQKLQEQARPPQEMDQVMHAFPAGVVSELTKIAWPCAVERDFKAPFRASLRSMDERDAARAAKSQPLIPNGENGGSGDPARKANGENGRGGDPPPKANGENGGKPSWWDQLVEEMIAETRGMAPAPRRN
ncbi:MAG TPA: hypothetical protein VKE94_00025 [Gemmataceae bacterium]|nr:hypothetical protein [Gemmataceae bacterium]